MGIVYLGTSEFAVTVLRALAASEFRPRLVVAPPDRPSGRGRRMASPPAAAAAHELEIELLQTGDVNDPEAVEVIAAADPDPGVVCAFGQLLAPPILERVEVLNVHPSLLPRWRGAAPIERALLAGDERTGVSVVRVAEELDAGPIALEREVVIEAGEDYGSLSARLAVIGGELIVEALERRRRGQLELAEQDESAATYAEKIDPTERRLDPARPAIQLERAVRALTPHIGAYLELSGGERLGVRAARAEHGSGQRAGNLEASGGELRLVCSEGVLRFDVVQPAGGRPMPAAAYLRGHAPSTA